MRLYTIGFTKTSAESFFSRLIEAGVKKVVDVRLRNTSQLAGYAKRDDLRYFLQTIAGIEYEHKEELAPTKELLLDYKKVRKDWDAYERQFLELMAAREVEKTLSKASLNRACLLCSEASPERCHRRVVAEYLQEKWGDIEIVHL